MYKTICGDNREALKEYPDNHFDSCVTDPPAGIAFMGKNWDQNKGGRDKWIEWMTGVASDCLRVLKPGAHALVWSLPRTSHWTAMAWEDTGFEVRDKITHIFGQGFPKNMDISKQIDKKSGVERKVIGIKPGHEEFANRTTQGHIDFKDGTAGFDRPWMHNDKSRKQYHLQTAPSTPEAKQWEGWGNALKPSTEDWWLLRKPISEKTVAENVLKWGCGGLNIDASRVGVESIITHSGGRKSTENYRLTKEVGTTHQGRFPANLILDEEAGQMLDLQTGTLKSGKMKAGTRRKAQDEPGSVCYGVYGGNATDADTPGDSGGASRFFYCAKASKAERGTGNIHPTVKPQSLMRYLVRLVTRPGGLVLDPFMGSGTTGVACISEGFDFVGIDITPEYVEMANARIASVKE